VIDQDGAQQALFPYNDPGQLPIAPLRHPDGEWLRLQLDLPGYPIWLRAWEVQVGRVKLYLLDSNDAANFPPYRGITSELYGGGPYLRLMQELVLGIGGWRLLASLGIEPEVCHLNEGHAAFAVLERARCFMQATGQPFDVALAVTRAGNLFTTHTAVAAGFDRFPPALVEQYLRGYAEQNLGITVHDLLVLGRENPNDLSEPFNMEQYYLPAASAYLQRARDNGALGSQIVNWRHALDQNWNALRFGEAKTETRDEQHVFELQVYLDDLDPTAVRVELYADGLRGNAPVRQAMKCIRQLDGEAGGYVYRTSVSAIRPPTEYTARVIPRFDRVAVPLEEARVLWKR